MIFCITIASIGFLMGGFTGAAIGFIIASIIWSVI